MALLNKIRKDMKKSSYYVWFLGAQESKGLRGPEYITPVLRSLIQREKSVEPFKITLQVSHKGLKIIQNIGILNANAKPLSAKGEPKPNKNDVIKHFIPHHAVTCVLQEDDVVACILLLYNPVTRCPVHVHGYRCDSIETASVLTQQLSTLIERPDNQKKLTEIEGRLRAKGLLLPTVPRVNIPKRLNSSGSDGRSTTSPASESSGGSSGGGQNERMSNLYDSLAAELREKLGMGSEMKIVHAPILLPPRDYDTVHRQKGNLAGIEMRRCLNENIVGPKTKPDNFTVDTKDSEKKGKGGPLRRVLGSSGGSSGIGSDHPPSPEHNGRYLDTRSTSDEEWAEHPSEESLFLVNPAERSKGWKDTEQVSLPRAKRLGSGEADTTDRIDSGFLRNDGSDGSKRSASPQPKPNIPIENFRKRNEQGNMSPVGVVAPRRRPSNEGEKYWEDEDSYKRRIPGFKEKMKYQEENEAYQQKMKRNEENRKISLKEKKMKENTMKLSPHERFLDAKTKFLMLEKERLEEQEKNLHNLEKKRIQQPEVPISPEIIKTRPSWPRRSETEKGLVRRNSFFEEEHGEAVKYYEKEQREKSSEGQREELLEQKLRARRLSRSDSRNRFFSQERLNGDVDYEVKYPGRRTSRQDSYPEEPRRYPKADYDAEPEPRRRGGASPMNPRRTPSDDEDQEQLRHPNRSDRRSRKYSVDGDSPPPRRSFDDEGSRRRHYAEEKEEVEPRGRYVSPARRNRSQGRDEPMHNNKARHEMAEKDKKLSSNALAKEFKRRSQEMGRVELEQRYSYGDRDRGRGHDDRYRASYHDELGYPDRADAERRNQYNRGEPVDFKKSSRELAKEFNRRSRGHSYDEDDVPRSRRPGGGYQELSERDRHPGLDKESSRPSIDDRGRYSERRSRTPDEDRFCEPPRLSQLHMDKMPARYRHSFVEATPGLSVMQPRHEPLHRTNSSVSSNRVGIAAVHPY